ncbi:hypothetical protein ASG39_18565 [Rhizobium sp. Leaf371]|uniref:hypothetical protein n=1 Tax=unclassified Rhizobium TaxID=2613769 RepID=UPI000715F7DA|nr:MULTISPECIES: hypothetical protein [unclassified Rhizobium]KQS59330.1 hypothetical protein ASG39_18565 [Rhizobium sp. Leaf371]TCM52755.1 hypothetical protein C8J36_108200 [Rhizobium sp. PP-F2F-G48]
MAKDEKKDPFQEIEKFHLLHEAQLLALVATFEQTGTLKGDHYKANVLALSETLKGTPNYGVADALVAFSSQLGTDKAAVRK